MSVFAVFYRRFIVGIEALRSDVKLCYYCNASQEIKSIKKICGLFLAIFIRGSFDTYHATTENFRTPKFRDKLESASREVPQREVFLVTCTDEHNLSHLQYAVVK